MTCNQTILLVDDDEDDRELLTNAVQSVNAEARVIAAENGIIAIDYLANLREPADLPCLIVLDLNMPFLSGLDTYRKIKTGLQLEGVPVIIFTSSSSPHDQAFFQQLNVEFITKPESFTYLREVASHMLEVCRKAAG